MTSLTSARRTSERLEADERRRQLLDVARRIFSERPFGAVSVEEIAEEAGVARGLVNHYFGNKRDLYVEVVREMMQTPPPPMPERTSGVAIKQRVRESLDAWLEMVERNRETWLCAIRSQGLGDQQIAALLEEAREKAALRMLALLGFEPAKGVGPERLAMMRAYGGLAEAATVQWLEHQRLSRPQVLELLVESATRLARGLHEVVVTTQTAADRDETSPSRNGSEATSPSRNGSEATSPSRNGSKATTRSTRSKS